MHIIDNILKEIKIFLHIKTKYFKIIISVFKAIEL